MTFECTNNVSGRLFIEDAVTAGLFIGYLRNTTTEGTHSSASFGTAGANGSTLYDVFGVVQNGETYSLELSSTYDLHCFAKCVNVFFSITETQIIGNYPTEEVEISLNQDGGLSFNSETRRYGTAVTTHQPYLQEHCQSYMASHQGAPAPVSTAPEISSTFNLNLLAGLAIGAGVALLICLPLLFPAANCAALIMPSIFCVAAGAIGLFANNRQPAEEVELPGFTR